MSGRDARPACARCASHCEGHAALDREFASLYGQSAAAALEAFTRFEDQLGGRDPEGSVRVRLDVARGEALLMLRRPGDALIAAGSAIKLAGYEEPSASSVQLRAFVQLDDVDAVFALLEALPATVFAPSSALPALLLTLAPVLATRPLQARALLHASRDILTEAFRFLGVRFSLRPEALVGVIRASNQAIEAEGRYYAFVDQVRRTRSKGAGDAAVRRTVLAFIEAEPNEHYRRCAAGHLPDRERPVPERQ